VQLLPQFGPQSVPSSLLSLTPLEQLQLPLMQVSPADTPHSLSGSVPVVMGAQVPLWTPVFASLQATHFDVHSLSQQYPSTQ